MLENKISPSFIEKQENVFWRLKELENSNIEFLNNQIKTKDRELNQLKKQLEKSTENVRRRRDFVPI